MHSTARLSPTSSRQRGAFSLLEITIVLVVIGLTAGGILAGSHLIEAGKIQAQISQINQFRTAIKTFEGKYDALPGDIKQLKAARFGFVTRAGTQGRGDGNNLFEAYRYALSAPMGLQWSFNGEPALFWRDLSSAGLLETTFTTAADASPTIDSGCCIKVKNISRFIPTSKLDNDKSVYVYTYNRINYFGLSGITYQNATNEFAVDSNGHLYTTSTIKVSVAFSIDTKIDDGTPTLGDITAVHVGGAGAPITATTAATASATTCYDTTTLLYSMSQNDGRGQNCALSFLIKN